MSDEAAGDNLTGRSQSSTSTIVGEILQDQILTAHTASMITIPGLSSGISPAPASQSPATQAPQLQSIATDVTHPQHEPTLSNIADEALTDGVVEDLHNDDDHDHGLLQNAPGIIQDLHREIDQAQENERFGDGQLAAIDGVAAQQDTTQEIMKQETADEEVRDAEAATSADWGPEVAKPDATSQAPVEAGSNEQGAAERATVEPEAVDVEAATAEGQEKNAESIGTFGEVVPRSETETTLGDLVMEDGATNQDSEFLEAAAALQGQSDAEWQYDSSDAEAFAAQNAASSDSSDTSDSSDSEDEDVQTLTREEIIAGLLEMDGDEDDEGGGSGKKGAKETGPTTQHEQPRPPVIRIEKVVTLDMKITEFGVLEHIIEQPLGNGLVSLDLSIKSVRSDAERVLDIGSLVCLEDRRMVGAISETFGPVKSPFYMVPFASIAEVQALGLEKGTRLYYVDEDAIFVFTEPLRHFKGSDASNIYDEEVADHEMEFSDDEAEAEHKKRNKEQKQANARLRDPRPVNTTARSPTQYRKSGVMPAKTQEYPVEAMNYDDNDEADVQEEDGYTVLQRPEKLQNGPPQRGSMSLGRGRGDMSRKRDMAEGEHSARGAFAARRAGSRFRGDAGRDTRGAASGLGRARGQDRRGGPRGGRGDRPFRSRGSRDAQYETTDSHQSHTAAVGSAPNGVPVAHNGTASRYTQHSNDNTPTYGTPTPQSQSRPHSGSMSAASINSAPSQLGYHQSYGGSPSGYPLPGQSMSNFHNAAQPAYNGMYNMTNAQGANFGIPHGQQNNNPSAYGALAHMSNNGFGPGPDYGTPTLSGPAPHQMRPRQQAYAGAYQEGQLNQQTYAGAYQGGQLNQQMYAGSYQGGPSYGAVSNQGQHQYGSTNGFGFNATSIVRGTIPYSSMPSVAHAPNYGQAGIIGTPNSTHGMNLPPGAFVNPSMQAQQRAHAHQRNPNQRTYPPNGHSSGQHQPPNPPPFPPNPPPFG